MTKRGYSRVYPTRNDERVKYDIDWIPPTLYARVRRKLKRLQAQGIRISLRSLTLGLWEEWLEEPDPDA